MAARSRLFSRPSKFFLFYTIPQDFAQLSCGKNCSPENIAVIREN
ncbi:hypothetical protein ACWEQJ_25915, partial [Streptomyces cyaneofuscatus]